MESTGGKLLWWTKTGEYLNKKKSYFHVHGLEDSVLSSLYGECQTPQIIKTHERKKSKVVGLALPDLKTYYEAIIIKTAWCRWTDRHEDQRTNRGPRSGIQTHSHLNSEAKAVLWTKDSLQQRVVEQLGF